jgi:methyl-accepting chemotaxis protein
MEEQSGRAQEIDQDMMKLSDEMHQTTTSLKESFFAMEQLSEAARDLQDEVSRFKVN